MNWITKFIKPKIKSLFEKKSSKIDENFWTTCGCKNLIYKEDLQSNLKCCPKCGAHHKLSCRERFDIFFDNKEYELIESPLPMDDPLKFEDNKKYIDRLKSARKITQQNDAVLIARGKVKDMPFIFFSCSGGQRMMESSIALMQMSRTALAVSELKKKNIPYVVVLTNPTTGGVTASWAMLGDILIAEPKATIGFAGRRVIQDTVRETLPEEFQTAEYVKDHGGIDLVVERKYLNSTIGTFLSVLLKKAESQVKNEASNVTVDQSLQSAS